MSDYVSDIRQLEELYGRPGSASLRKVAQQMTPLYRKWIMASRFCVVSTIGPDGTDGSPRGDDGPVVRELDEHTLLMPDWRGNNRMDSLRNIVADGRISLMFMVAGSDTIVRVNGLARVSVSDDLITRFNDRGRVPRSVIVVKIGEIYTQCARAPMRAGLWTSGDQSEGLPTAGEILAEQTAGEEGGKPYDDAWLERAKASLWSAD
ncbi:pyridoxamine 5'-phosphate oxidase family protein [Lentibacter algarum]|uniref:pyridoxamine 5'-phosphate oxidase family protein n=1 Tax=Lentibacter algarum TaxID=576131 RepID=UPI001C08E5B3|nr:pyridoxamine 5'-phosphate oxidase family protein [Lentibacter algarum]MBU2983570.1 pyridoxamine 5'-phosphate oxidase family protein [Lentibacter algarum]